MIVAASMPAKIAKQWCNSIEEASAIRTCLAMMPSANEDWRRYPWVENMTGHLKLAIYFCVAHVAWCSGAHAQSQVVGAPPEASNMKLVGTNDLQARSAYQPTIHHQGDRFIAYIGHHGGTALNSLTGRVEANGTSVVDVTDPRNP